MKKFRISGCLFVVMLAVIMLAGCTRDRSGTQTQTQTGAQTQTSSVPAETSIGESGGIAPGMGMDTESGLAPSEGDSQMTMPDNQNDNQNSNPNGNPNGNQGNEESTGVIGGLADDLERAVTNAADEVTGE